tara:strand:+ start:97 stop:522 length:426 start_codon:yes stop_codon:yes gene_type:complete
MSEWSHIKLIEMLVIKAEYNFSLSKPLDKILLLSCELLNIARGRCEVKFMQLQDLRNPNMKTNEIFISSKKPVMSANVELEENAFSNLNSYLFKYSNLRSKKVKITFLIDKAIATNSEGILSLDEDLYANLKKINFNIPIF